MRFFHTTKETNKESIWEQGLRCDNSTTNGIIYLSFMIYPDKGETVFEIDIPKEKMTEWDGIILKYHEDIPPEWIKAEWRLTEQRRR